jgi:glycine/D-amino acid oxidase-like deaminating enzyme
MVRVAPYWWDETPPRPTDQKPVAPSCDVAVVGGGYTGLSAAMTLARAGRSVQVFEKSRPGEGASTRNGGIASGNLRLTFAEMIKRFGMDRAQAIQAEAKAAREDLASFLAAEAIDCDYTMSGRFSGASSPDQYETLAREADLLARHLGIQAYAVPRHEQHDALGTDYCWGGMVRMDIGGLDPAKMHAGMLRSAEKAGATVVSGTAVRTIRRRADGTFDVTTDGGTTHARDVIVGTNGYTDAADPWLRRRLIPVASSIIATAPLSPNLMATLMPRRFMCVETRKLHYYYRPSPDGKRILFGGRGASLNEKQDRVTSRLRQALVDVFPQLSETPLTHSWSGNVAMNRDLIPRIFTRKGIHYAAGYCGSGVVWARWAGQKVAWQVLGSEKGRSALDFRPPPAVPFYNGNPWFMPAVFAWYELQDRLARRRS